MNCKQAIEKLQEFPPEAEIGLFRINSKSKIMFYPLAGFAYNIEDNPRVGLAIPIQGTGIETT